MKRLPASVGSRFAFAGANAYIQGMSRYPYESLSSTPPALCLKLEY